MMDTDLKKRMGAKARVQVLQNELVNLWDKIRILSEQNEALQQELNKLSRQQYVLLAIETCEDYDLNPILLDVKAIAIDQDKDDLELRKETLTKKFDLLNGGEMINKSDWELRILPIRSQTITIDL